MEIGPIRNQNLIFLAACQCLVKIDKGQQKIKIIHTNQQSNLRASCQSIFSLCQHHPTQRHVLLGKVKPLELCTVASTKE